MWSQCVRKEGREGRDEDRVGLRRRRRSEGRNVNEEVLRRGEASGGGGASREKGYREEGSLREKWLSEKRGGNIYI